MRNLLLAATAMLATLSLPAKAELPAPLLAKVNAAVDADSARLTAIFKDLHANPEIAFTETRTAAIVAKELKALGFTVTTGIGKTGVVGVLRNGPGKTLWYRADMDANGVKEATGLPYAATKPQKLADGSEQWAMHACGHDAHVTWLLGTAKAMVALKDAWSGTLVVYGQPAEEVGTGAQAMVQDGLLERGFPKPDFGMGSHTAPGPVGYVSNTAGVRMAGTDQLDVTFTGLGGHGSTPQMTIDPVVMAAQAIMGYQTIISRTVDPQTSAVLTVGAVEAGRDNNVIPASATLKLNLRWFDDATRNTLIKRIDEVSKGVAIGAGITDEAKMPKRVMKGNAGPLKNDAALVDIVNPGLTSLLGDGKVIGNFPAVMGSEDFQEVMNAAKVPYVFLLIGVAPMDRVVAAQKAGRPFPYSNHNPDFFVDLAAVPLGAKINTVAALSLLAKP
ncbi:amidohydrolase [Sandaracinobacteroides saxicola]|uniref:Amidohydrolase n=1 Tax=Sandaracinobacteroides saxicola TaxID=2759707 RepID=A0A7G5IL19_9SPHN|nr:amidohydrolase [Sandaracinobacteroides saxicola]QMW24061.1 amidohydrolase [Sandaracinobacteroides saxicola]